jgi:hypothetical protein
MYMRSTNLELIAKKEKKNEKENEMNEATNLYLESLHGRLCAVVAIEWQKRSSTSWSPASRVVVSYMAMPS